MSPANHPSKIKPRPHQAVEAALEEKRAWLVQLEGQSQALSGYVTPGEAGRIRARLGQMGRGLEELRGRVQQLIGQLQQSASHRQRYSDNLEQVSSDPIERLEACLSYDWSTLYVNKMLGFQRKLE